MAAVDSFSLLYREVARSCNTYVETLALVGALYTASKTCLLLRDCCNVFRVHFLHRVLPTRKKLSQRFGEWAVINGASDDVARAYAEELARQGINIMFVSHDRTLNMDMSMALTHCGVEVTAVQADFALGEAAIKPVRDAVMGKDVGILVNCGYDSLASRHDLTETSVQGLWELLNRTVVAATLMTALLLPCMAQQRRGAVVNLSCGACSRPSLGKVVPFTSAGFMVALSRALQLEYGHQGVYIQSLTPCQVSSRGRPPSTLLAVGDWLAPRPEVYARHAVSTLGATHRTTGYWPHTLQCGFMTFIPEWIWVLGSGFCC